MIKHTWPIALLAGVIAFAGATPAAPPPLQLAATLYYTALEEDYPAGNSGEFRDRSGAVLRRGSEVFLAAAAIEGTAEFEDGTVLNYHIRVDGEVRWIEVEHGLDARGCALVPYRSAAVDPEVVPLGTSLRIAETVGMPLPGGGKHDGIWIATDTGTNIIGDRIDLYVGRGKGSMGAVYDFGIEHLERLTVQTLQGDSPCFMESGGKAAASVEDGQTTAY